MTWFYDRARARFKTLLVDGNATVSGNLAVNGVALSLTAANGTNDTTFTVSNTTDSAGSDASLNVVVGGASAGNPYIGMFVTGVTSWLFGINNSASDVLVWNPNSTIGTADAMTLSTAGVLSVKNKIYPGSDAAALQSAAGIYAGSGAPNNANGTNGDFYFRSDGTAGSANLIYHREGGAWVGII